MGVLQEIGRRKRVSLLKNWKGPQGLFFFFAKGAIIELEIAEKGRLRLTLDEILTAIGAIEKLDRKEEILAGLQAVQTDLRTKGKDLSGLRTRATTAETKASALTERITRMLEFQGVTDEASIKKVFDAPDDQIDGILDEVIKPTSTGTGGAGKGPGAGTAEIEQFKRTISGLQRENSRLKTDLETANKTTTEERGKRQGLLREREVLAALTANKALKPQVLAKIVAGNVKFLEDESMVYVDGDQEITIADGVKAFLAANPEFVEGAQRPGAGGGTGGGGGGKDGILRVTRTQLRDPAFYQANAEKIRAQQYDIIGD